LPLLPLPLLSLPSLTLRQIDGAANIPAFLERVKRKKAKLMGFGHRVYKVRAEHPFL